MIAIRCKYLPPTNTRGARVKAYAEQAMSITLSWDHKYGFPANASRAAKAFATRYDWGGMWYGGSIGDEYVFVNHFGPSFRVK